MTPQDLASKLAQAIMRDMFRGDYYKDAPIVILAKGLIQLESKLAAMQKVVSAMREMFFRDDSGHITREVLSLLDALKQLDELDAKDGEG